MLTGRARSDYSLGRRRKYEIQAVRPQITNTTPKTQRMVWIPDVPDVKGIMASQATPIKRKVGPIHRATHCWRADDGRLGVGVTVPV